MPWDIDRQLDNIEQLARPYRALLREVGYDRRRGPEQLDGTGFDGIDPAVKASIKEAERQKALIKRNGELSGYVNAITCLSTSSGLSSDDSERNEEMAMPLVKKAKRAAKKYGLPDPVSESKPLLKDLTHEEWDRKFGATYKKVNDVQVRKITKRFPDFEYIGAFICEGETRTWYAEIEALRKLRGIR